MRVLVACEFSGVVRQAFREQGHLAYSCDVLPAEDSSPYHLQGDIFEILQNSPFRWDLMIAHPPCTHLAVSGAKHFPAKRADGRQAAALDFVQRLFNVDIPCIALENPVSIISTHIRKPDQIVDPFWFGHREFKRTCLWLKELPPLQPTDYIRPPSKVADFEEWRRWNRVHRETPGPDRWKNRSRTFTGFAEAMAMQWGCAEIEQAA